ncbi:unnamed protein product [Gadus morhua 'NCC']
MRKADASARRRSSPECKWKGRPNSCGVESPDGPGETGMEWGVFRLESAAVAAVTEAFTVTTRSLWSPAATGSGGFIRRFLAPVISRRVSEKSPAHPLYTTPSHILSRSP